MTETLRSEDVSTKLQSIAELARKHPERVFTSLAHVIDVEWLKEAHRRTRKDAAVGIDRQTASEYALNLDANLESLCDRFHKGTYRAPPVRRVHIPKGTSGDTRPIGIPTFEDKVLQRAVSMLLEAIYEQDFKDCSYGFRPGRSAHQALKKIQRRVTTEMAQCWIVEVDIRGFFDSLDHPTLRAILDRRVKDGRVRRMIDKWLKAGVAEDGAIRRPSTGTPQGGVISPLLANIYLHVVLDEWFEAEVKPRLAGRSFMVRYADDFVIAVQTERDAKRLMNVLPKRFGKYGLTLHSDKTRVVMFNRPRRGGRDDDDPKPGSFNFLGFTHYWARSRRGNHVVKQKTAKDRFSRALKRARLLCRRIRHLPVRTQHAILSRLLRGHYGYYGITGNGDALNHFRQAVEEAWRKWLGRRSRARMTWERFKRIQARYALPPTRVVHSIVPSEPMA